MRLITLDEFKTYLGIDLANTDNDDKLNAVIDEVSRLIEQYVGYSFDEKVVKEYSDYGSIDFVATQRNIKDENQIKVFEHSSNTEYKIDYIDGRLVYLFEDTAGGKIRIEYLTGYADETEVPLDLKQVAYSWGEKAYNKNLIEDGGNGDLQIKTKKLGSLSLTYFSNKEMETSNNTSEGAVKSNEITATNILDKYKITFIYG